MIIAFDTAEDLERWTTSAERRELLAEAEPYVEQYNYRPATSAFESWFTSASERVKPPPSWKLTSIVLLVLYPVVMLEILLLLPLMTGAGEALSNFVANAISVAITGFLLIPWASRALRWWLVPPESDQRRRTIVGASVVVALYVFLVAVFAVIVHFWSGLR